MTVAPSQDERLLVVPGFATVEGTYDGFASIGLSPVRIVARAVSGEVVASAKPVGGTWRLTVPGPSGVPYRITPELRTGALADPVEGRAGSTGVRVELDSSTIVRTIVRIRYSDLAHLVGTVTLHPVDPQSVLKVSRFLINWQDSSVDLTGIPAGSYRVRLWQDGHGRKLLAEYPEAIQLGFTSTEIDLKFD